MYEDWFGFRERPFPAAPRPERYFAANLIEAARQTLARTIDRGAGPGLLIGPVGTGKSLLFEVLAAQFADSFDVVLLRSGRLATRGALLQAILYDLRLPYRGMDEGELRLALVDHLEPSEGGKQGLLLLVDEAHTLPLRVLEEIRLLTNLVRDGQPRVRVVLAGSSQLEERFASPRLATFAQRLAARVYLDALDAAESAAYVRGEIESAGGDAERLLDEATLRSIHRASDGIPRLINQVCDHALLLASLGGKRQLSSAAIEEAWADLQQLPAPWSESNAPANANVIEFGPLEDPADAPLEDAPEAIPFRGHTVEALHLASTDDERGGDEAPDSPPPYAPAARHRTEIELSFPEFGDPDNELFEEEEVVLDRYPHEVDIFAHAPRVSSWESTKMASLLESLSGDRTSNEQPVEEPFVSAAITAEAFYPDDIPSTAPPISSFAASETTCQLPVEAILSETTTTQPAREAQLPPPDTNVCERAPVSAESAAFWAGANSLQPSPMIVVEDEVPGAFAPPSKRPYRQLFAKLRRG